MISEPVRFAGFEERSLKFLAALGFHQNREWFHENKDLYLQLVKEPMGYLVEAASTRFAKLDIPLHGTRKTSLYKVNRDVRFAKNKDPYNTHASAVLTRNGTKKDGSGAYMHFKPGNCLFAAGVWYPEPLELRALRETIIKRRDEFLAIEHNLASKGLSFDSEKALKRVPPAFKHIEDLDLQRLLKQKSFTVTRHVEDADIQSPALIETLIELTQDTMPLMQFCWRAMDPLRDQ
ncbi:DUF2461 domain-containing protein [Ahrensia sp. 13_GOM-1096m]|uniref:DUF2461 domain-containing protein n=1 Tax=Ahrensia sp. 13_GOM-1096m TaxID=1380380 RepID=UPI00047B8437|nr:TIGR02453 family protein [Ahrensia sp. 13_GOM-1096m]